MVRIVLALIFKTAYVLYCYYPRSKSAALRMLILLNYEKTLSEYEITL